MRSQEQGARDRDTAVDNAPSSLRAIVRGRVQGVNFRSFVATRARFLGLDGYARNLADGRTVEVVADGAREALEQLLEYMREGPRSSRVESVEVEWGEASGRWTDFGVIP